ncbi:MAG: BrxE family protein, partial [Verrucomicrobiae bacterium]|nr:BrxE family protein [Verrucomicrobiae bacterium]
GWWNTRGVLSGMGRSVLSRGFSHTHHFAQARIACSVATARCQSIFNPPGCITLWNLPAEIDDSIEQAWPDWCRKSEPWNPFFESLAVLPSKPLVDLLLDLDLIDAATADAVAPLKRSAEGRSVALPGTGKPDTPSIMLLAAAFSKGEPQKPAVPYLRLDA